MGSDTLLSVDNPRILPEFRELIVGLAELDGSPTEVEFSDLQKFYERHNIQGKYRLNKGEFKSLQSLIQGQQDEKSVTMGYNSFFAHLSQVRMFKDQPCLTVGEALSLEDRKLEGAERDRRRKERTPTAAELLNKLPPKIPKSDGLQKAMEALTNAYPYRHIYVKDTELRASITGFEDRTVAIGHMYGLSLVTGYRILDVRSDGSFFMGELDDRFRISAEYYTAQGNRAWSLFVDASRVMRTDDNIFGLPFIFYRVIGGRGRADKKIWASVPVSITTNLKMSQWQAFVKDRPHHPWVWDLLSGHFANRIKEQIDRKP